MPHDIFGEQGLWIPLEIEQVLAVSGPGEVGGRFGEYVGQEFARIGIEYTNLVNSSAYEVLRNGDEAPIVGGCQVSKAVVVIAVSAFVAVNQDFLGCLKATGSPRMDGKILIGLEAEVIPVVSIAHGHTGIFRGET